MALWNFHVNFYIVTHSCQLMHSLWFNVFIQDVLWFPVAHYQINKVTTIVCDHFRFTFILLLNICVFNCVFQASLSHFTHLRRSSSNYFLLCPEETKIGEEISVVSHSFLLDNYEIYVRPKWGCGWFLLFLSCFSWETGAENLNLGSL